MNVAPYPYERWPRWTRAAVRRARTLARLAGAADDAVGEACLNALESPLGGRAELGPLRPGRTLPHQDPTVALILRVPWAPDAPAALELDVDLAHALVDRTLGGEGRGRPEVLGEVAQGVLTWLASSVLEAVDIDVRVAGVLTRRAAVEALTGGDPPLRGMLTIPGGARGTLTLHLGRSAPEEAPAPPGLGAFAAATLPAYVDGGSATITAAELRTLGPGDVVLLDAAYWRDGRATLCVAGLRWALRRVGAQLALEARLPGRPPAHTKERTMTTTSRDPASATPEEDTRTDDTTLTDLDEAPVELSLELARFSLRLAEARRLRVGEVLGTGARLGDRVRLRAGDAVVAEGELVDIEGEVGVRILRLRT